MNTTIKIEDLQEWLNIPYSDAEALIRFIPKIKECAKRLALGKLKMSVCPMEDEDLEQEIYSIYFKCNSTFDESKGRTYTSYMFYQASHYLANRIDSECRKIMAQDNHESVGWNNFIQVEDIDSLGPNNLSPHFEEIYNNNIGEQIMLNEDKETMLRKFKYAYNKLLKVLSDDDIYILKCIMYRSTMGEIAQGLGVSRQTIHKRWKIISETFKQFYEEAN